MYILNLFDKFQLKICAHARFDSFVGGWGDILKCYKNAYVVINHSVITRPMRILLNFSINFFMPLHTLSCMLYIPTYSFKNISLHPCNATHWKMRIPIKFQ